MELAGRVGIVTGPERGMAAAIALALARAGADLVLAGRDTDAITPVAAQVAALGRRAAVVRCDVTRAGDADAAAAAALDLFRRIDILVTVAAGAGTRGTNFWETAPEDFSDLLALALTGGFLMMRAVMPAMIARGGGRIVHVGAATGARDGAGRAADSAATFGLLGLTRAAALEAARHNVTVNRVGLGRAGDDAPPHPPGDEDVAAAVLYLASDRARRITGQEIAVNAGRAI
jgi:3-oxoacyl-[acyl-carrier protein] reductase